MRASVVLLATAAAKAIPAKNKAHKKRLRSTSWRKNLRQWRGCVAKALKAIGMAENSGQRRALKLWSRTRIAGSEYHGAHAGWPCGWVYFAGRRCTSISSWRRSLFISVGQTGRGLPGAGLSQGTFRINRDARTGTEKITQESSSANFDQRTRQFHADGIRGMALTAFREKLRQALDRSVALEH